ncbi:hypothetical protein CDAR_270481 [Caerostris darwini]|uniref:Uncharacterized protein n=1 Tax=Caerostris darwini TaxID=1538125 RepID=A0AAV4NIC0_9ARAC|nr:hypothetical protein CDAR_270481 [Caerostris darwini]
MHYGGGSQDVVVEPDDDEKNYKCDSIMPPTPYVKEECMDDEPSSQEPSTQETTAVPNDEPSQEIPEYDEIEIDLSAPLVIVEDDLLVENEESVNTEQATPSTSAQNHEDTIPSTSAQKQKK